MLPLQIYDTISSLYADLARTGQIGMLFPLRLYAPRNLIVLGAFGVPAIAEPGTCEECAGKHNSDGHSADCLTTSHLNLLRDQTLIASAPLSPSFAQL
jgi:hypothetical protein